MSTILQPPLIQTFGGMRVIVSPILQDTPIINFNSSKITEIIGEPFYGAISFNRWLGETFGTKPPFFIMGGDTFITNARGHALLQKMRRNNSLGTLEI